MATETVAGSLSVQAIPDPQYGEIVDTYGNEFKVPDFTIKQIRDAIPRHCFERSALRGFAYITRDILLLASTFYIFHNYATVEYVRSSRFRFCLWTFHGFLQGLFAIGIWIIAHDCGHQAFSLSKPLDDAMGWMLHSTFFVFCFSWKISHGKHHKNSGYMDRDMAFLPKIREVYASRVRRKVHELTELTEEAPLVTAGILLGRQLIGWFLYLLQNRIEHNNHQRQSEGRGVGKYNGLAGGVNHFNPSSSLFEAKDAKYILLSDLGLGLMAFLLYEIAQIFGWYSILTRYIVPYLWVYHWLGMTFFIIVHGLDIVSYQSND